VLRRPPRTLFFHVHVAAVLLVEILLVLLDLLGRALLGILRAGNSA
jgi:hypothetical protein